MWFSKKKTKNGNCIKTWSNVIQFDCLGYPLRLVITNDGDQRWIDTVERDNDITLEWRNIMKYRKKPVVVEAVRWTGNNIDELESFVGDSFVSCEVLSNVAWQINNNISPMRVSIRALGGLIYAVNGDYIIKGVQGEFYPCKADIFEQMYEKV